MIGNIRQALNLQQIRDLDEERAKTYVSAIEPSSKSPDRPASAPDSCAFGGHDNARRGQDLVRDLGSDRIRSRGGTRAGER